MGRYVEEVERFLEEMGVELKEGVRSPDDDYYFKTHQGGIKDLEIN